MPKEQVQCKDCKYYDPKGSEIEKRGACHWYPPFNGTVCIYEDNWCGQWKEKEK